MARIRSLKPEFWTDEKVVAISPLARLLFMGLWNFADDEGRMVYSPMRIKLQILPADSVDISALLGEIRGKEMVNVYEVDGIEYLQIINFGKHQKVDKRTPSKYPPYINGTPNSPESQLFPTPDQGREGIKEGIKEGIEEASSEKPAALSPPCPHEEIIDLYHEILPMGRQVRKNLWRGSAREKHLQARWREEKDRQSTLWWGKLFHHIAQSEFLTGKVPPRRPGEKPFEISLDWIVEKGNFIKILEGKYDG
jgi:hypothetical protein